MSKKYMESFGLLYGVSLPEKIFKSPLPVKKISEFVRSEDDEQIHLVVWLTKQNIPFFAIPNGGSRHKLEGYKLKRAGVQRGIPDLMLPLCCGKHHGLFIEMKRVKMSRVTDEQQFWIDLLNKNGYKAVVCYGFEDAKKIVEDYLGSM